MPRYLQATLPGPFRLRRGGELREVTLAYETWGELSPARDNVLLLTTGLSPGSHARSSPRNPEPGWWEGMIGPGRALDTDRYHVVCNNSLGSCHGSTGPASIDPDTSEPYRLRFPLLSVEDIAASSRALLKSLGIERVKAVVGSSLGGMTSLAYASLFPDEVELLVSISAATAASPQAIAFRSLQREAIRSDPDWRDGQYEAGHAPRRGMTLARKLGVITYRSADEWKTRFGRERVVGGAATPFGSEFEVESYLTRHAERFVGGFDANCYLYLSRAMDLFDLADCQTSAAAPDGAAEIASAKSPAGSLNAAPDGAAEIASAKSPATPLEAAFARIRARRCLVIGVETDFLFPIEQQEQLARGLQAAGRDTVFARLPSIQGHDSFLIDLARFGPVVKEFLAS